MRFQRFINENVEESLERKKDNIINACQPFLKMLKKTGYNFLYSGRQTSKDVYKRKVRKNRRPSDTPQEIHDVVDNIFKREFGVRARGNSMFASVEWRAVRYYGAPYYLFPVGKYKLIWSSKVPDLFAYIKKTLMDEFNTGVDLGGFFRGIRDDEEYFEEVMSFVEMHFEEKVLPTYNETRDTSDIKTPNEIMVITDEMWLVNSIEISSKYIYDFIRDNI